MLGQFVTCRVDELRHHPSYIRNHLTVSAAKLSAVAEQGEEAFRDLIVITRDRTIIDGYARWELARLEGRPTLACVEYELNEEEALRCLVQKHRRSNGMNDFCLILLALELEPRLKEKALSNQRLGGRMKGSSNLTRDAIVDVRTEIAAAAGVSVGNVTKVKQLVRIGHAELLEALRGGEVSIHRAWKWSTESLELQIEILRTYRNEKGLKKAIRDLISRQGRRSAPTGPDLTNLARRLSELSSAECGALSVGVIRAKGKMIFVTEELMQFLAPYQEKMPTCTTDNR
jgi:hypothetical protein